MINVTYFSSYSIYLGELLTPSLEIWKKSQIATSLHTLRKLKLKHDKSRTHRTTIYLNDRFRYNICIHLK